MSAKYWIAQYTPDMFRNEPKNIGVFVELNGAVECRFLGEIDGILDGRSLRSFPYPNVYRQWVEYWRREANRELEAVVKNPGSHYRVIEGGHTDGLGPGTETSSLRHVADYLYSTLVSEGGFVEALGVSTESEQQEALRTEVLAALKAEQLLKSSVVAHPIRERIGIMGQIGVEHKPAFSQENGRLYVMETVDFTQQKRQPSRDHAGWFAYVFNDIKAVRPNALGISIVRFTDTDERDNEDVKSSLAILRKESEMVNWTNASERDAFLKERRRVAMA